MRGAVSLGLSAGIRHRIVGANADDPREDDERKRTRWQGLPGEVDTEN